jgi:hypothetical protein
MQDWLHCQIGQQTNYPPTMSRRIGLRKSLGFLTAFAISAVSSRVAYLMKTLSNM